MTIATGTFTTYSAIGMREDLSDVIDNVAPTDTMFLSALRKEKCNARKFEWQTDTLASAANNAQIEGDDIASFTAITPTVRWDNYCQISSKNFALSVTEEVVDKAGRDSEIAYQTLNKIKEIKRDQNFALIQNGTYNAGAAATARQTRGLAGWITQGSVGAGVGAFPVPSTNTAAVAGTGRAFTETLLKSAMQAAWTAGGQPGVAYMRAADKVLASAFTGNATRYQKAETAELNAAVDVYVSDFGTIKLVAERQIDAAVYLVDHDHVSLVTLRPLSREVLAKTGDAEKRLVVTEYGLKMKNKDAHAQVRDLT